MPDLVAATFGVPQPPIRLLRPRRDTGGNGIVRIDRGLRNLASHRDDHSDGVAVRQGEPHTRLRPNRPIRDAERIGIARPIWRGEFGNPAIGRDSPDLGGVGLGEPQSTVRTCRDAEGVAIGRGNWKFGNHTGGRDAPDLVAGHFGEPQRAVRPRRDAFGAAVGRGDREFGEGLGGSRRGYWHGRPQQDDHRQQQALIAILHVFLPLDAHCALPCARRQRPGKLAKPSITVMRMLACRRQQRCLFIAGLRHVPVAVLGECYSDFRAPGRAAFHNLIFLFCSARIGN